MKMRVLDFLWVLVMHIRSVLIRNKAGHHFGEEERDGVCCLANLNSHPDELFTSCGILGRSLSKVT